MTIEAAAQLPQKLSFIKILLSSYLFAYCFLLMKLKLKIVIATDVF